MRESSGTAVRLDVKCYDYKQKEETQNIPYRPPSFSDRTSHYNSMASLINVPYQHKYNTAWTSLKYCTDSGVFEYT
jgi:hypothetical protein